MEGTSMATDDQYNITGNIIRVCTGNGTAQINRTGLKQRNGLDAMEFEETFRSNHPTSGNCVLTLYHGIMDYLRSQTLGTIPDMISLIKTQGLSSELEQKLDWCMNVAAIRDGPKKNKELYLLSNLLPPQVYRAISERYKLVDFPMRKR